MATLFQVTIQRASRIGGWMVAPINLLMATSTVVLGYHYLADVPAGMLLALAAVWIWTPHDQRNVENDRAGFFGKSWTRIRFTSGFGSGT